MAAQLAEATAAWQWQWQLLGLRMLPPS
eukprot:COSAG01_NODE_68351_length_264_cov_0.806061_1_plen_27_part_10